MPLDYTQIPALRRDLKELHYRLSKWEKLIRSQDTYEDDKDMDARELSEGYLWPAYRAIDDALDYVKTLTSS